MTTATIDQAVADAKAATKPVAKFRYRGISATVFLNESKAGKTFYKTRVERTFKVGDEFKANSSFTRDELPIVQHLTQKAYDWIRDREADQPAEQNRE